MVKVGEEGISVGRGGNFGEVKSFGVQAFLHIPMQGDAYIRLNNDQFDSLDAAAVLMPKEGEQ